MGERVLVLGWVFCCTAKIAGNTPCAYPVYFVDGVMCLGDPWYKEDLEAYGLYDVAKIGSAAAERMPKFIERKTEVSDDDT